MKITDDRTDQEKDTHTELVCVIDVEVTSWDSPTVYRQITAWACHPYHTEAVHKWACQVNKGMQIKLCDSASFKPRGKGHCHIQVVLDNHPAVKSLKTQAI